MTFFLRYASAVPALMLLTAAPHRAALVSPRGFDVPLFTSRRAMQAPSLVVTVAELSRELRDPSLVMLQVGPKDDYEAGHIPGARFVEMDFLSTPEVEGQPILELPDAATLRQRLESLGISDNSRIVVVPGKDWASPSTRVIFTLQAAGLGARTRLLDGGSEAWKRAKLSIVKDAPPPAKVGRLTVADSRANAVVDHTWIQSKIGAPGIRIIDARAPMFYEGAGMTHNGRTHGAGHIPSAKNIPFNTIMDDSLKLLPKAELQKMFAAAGVQPGDTVAAYCHIGQQATVVVFAARLLGIPVRLYDGSFTDWEARKLPIENPKASK